MRAPLGAFLASTRTKWILASVAAALVAFGGFVAFSMRLPKPTIASAAGKPAPDFTLKDQDGRDFTLSSQRGHKVLLMFYRGYW